MANDIVQEVKIRTDLVELISQYVPLKRSGRTHKGLCPFHQEKTPSFTVDGERGFYKCWGCGEGGDCFAFIQKREGVGFSEAGELLAKRLGLEWTRRGETAESRSERQRLYDVLTLGERFYARSLADSREARAYLDKRGLSDQTITDFRLGYAPPGYEALLRWLRREKVNEADAEGADLLLRREDGGYRDRFVDRIIFPIADLQGRAIGFGGRTMRPDGVPKYLNSRETPVFHKSRTLYGLDRARKAIGAAGFAVVVEGYMDVIALHQAGVENAVATLGTAITPDHGAILGRYSDSRALVLCFDGDSAGSKAALRASEFEEAGCDVRVATLPQGHDPDTFVRDYGADEFRSLLTRAEPLLDFQLRQLRGGYNLADDSQRLAFVRGAARVIAQSSSHLTRQEYGGRLTQILERLSEEWYPGQPHRAQTARIALTQEINRLLRTDRVTAPRREEGSAPSAEPTARSGKALAERYILRAMLSDDHLAANASIRLKHDYFGEAELLPLALVLLQDEPEDRSETIAARAAELRDDPGFSAAVSSLLVDEAPVSETGLEASIQLLEREWKQQRKRELMRLSAAGELSADDAEADELRGLMEEMGGGRQRRED